MQTTGTKKDVTASPPKSPTIKVVSVGLDRAHRDMLEALAVKYRIPQNLSHTLRLLIEDAYNGITEVKC
jgi:hypothetical protein